MDENNQNLESQAHFSLADLASMDTTSIKELTSLLPAVGVYRLRGLDVKAGQRESVDDKPPLYFINFQGEILSAKLADKNVDPTPLMGRKLTESFTLWPSQFSDMIGLVKGRYKNMGIPNTGRLGGVEGQEPGWLDNYIGAEFLVKITHYNSKGTQRANFAYLDMSKVKDESEEAAAA